MEYNLVELVPSEQIGLHSQPGWELSYILKGRGIRTVGDTESPFAEGDMVLVIPEMPHCWKFEEAPGSGIRNITLTFGRDFLDRVAALPGFGEVAERLNGMTASVEITGGTRSDIAGLLLQMQDEDRAGRTASALRILSMIGRGRDGTVAGRFRKSASAKEIVRKIQIYVICNSCRKLTLADAAMHAGMSRAGFCSFWKRETGETFMSFVTRHRLETACRLLKDPSLQVSDVCYESGFNDIPHFNRSFRRRFGVSPSAYRAGLKTE